jgi:hypothetical protein
MLILQERQVCPHSRNCPYNVNDSCQGSNPQRMNEFKCGYVQNGIIAEKKEVRNSFDKTGSMKVIME